MMIKRITALILVALIMPFGGVFADDSIFLSREQIPVDVESAEKLAELGMFFGTENGYELERDVTRAEALTMIDRLTGTGEFHNFIPEPYFVDMIGHWAEDTANLYQLIGLVHGTGNKLFTPDRTVSGNEFMKILLSAMEYPDVSLENAYSIGVESGVLADVYSKSAVYGNYPLTRSDIARISLNALTAKTYVGVYLFEQNAALTAKGEKFFYDTLIGTGIGREAYAEFADNIDKHMPDDKNYMFSPLSIKMALALAANGASGETLEEILSVTGIDNLQEYNEFSKFLIEKYSRTNVLKLDIANSVWFNTDNTPKRLSEDYASAMKKYYDASVADVTNINAVETVNNWVNDKTQGKISEIIDSPEFIVQLVNAIYFKGIWKNQFSPENTDKDVFTDKNGKETEMDFMFKNASIPYYEDEEAKIVELEFKQPRNTIESYDIRALNYTDISTSMYVILPEGELNVAKKIDAVDDQMKSTEVKLWLPKFEIEFSKELNDVLMEMGIWKAFSDDAELNEIFNEESGEPIDSVMHKTYIKVDEEGVEAAAVTAMGVGTGLGPRPEPVEFKVDRPFYFVIRDNINREILFMGEYAFVS